MAKLNFSVDATPAEFEDFANRLGYMAEVFVDDLPVPNPESRADFLLRVMKEAVAEKFYQPFVDDIQRQKDSQVDVQKENMRNTVRNRVTVSFSA